jgi:hypothetical protein
MSAAGASTGGLAMASGGGTSIRLKSGVSPGLLLGAGICRRSADSAGIGFLPRMTGILMTHHLPNRVRNPCQSQ